jgi:hypothetical protein
MIGRNRARDPLFEYHCAGTTTPSADDLTSRFPKRDRRTDAGRQAYVRTYLVRALALERMLRAVVK